MKLPTEWSIFKTAMLNTLTEICGKKKVNQDNKNKKRTLWWNNNVMEAIQTKKILFQTWAKSKAPVDYEAYKNARKIAKHTIKTAKEEAWKNYGEQLATICKERPRDFFKSINAMRVRDEPFNPTTVINNKNGTPIFSPNEKKRRWKEYFQELLNPNDVQRDYIYRPTNSGREEPSILIREIEEVVKKSPCHKSPGMDGITNEAIKACGDIGVK